MRSLLLFVIFSLLFSCKKVEENYIQEFPTPFEQSNKEETATYEEVLDFYKKLAKEFSSINMQTIGTTDSGHPLHVVTFSPKGNFNFKKLSVDHTLMLINNGIHPGESDGIDATMLLFRDLASQKIESPKQTIIATIPIYNIGGALNRNSTTRANQNGPKAYGFRGNARNYDLNRDFIKSDTKNAATFAEIYHLINPDVFIDNHVSNGADYQYTLTHLFTQHNKLGGALGNYVHQQFMPLLKDSLLQDNWEITPYVNVFNKPPETGFQQFMDHPRYSTGYTTLWNTLGMMVETHMLKPYKERVAGTYELMKNMIALSDIESPKIKEFRTLRAKELADAQYYPIAWQVDTTKSSTIKFKGFTADTITSEVTGFPRLKFNRQAPIENEIEYKDFFMALDSIEIPKAYVIGKQWSSIIDRLNMNHIQYETIKTDTLIQIESYSITDYQTVSAPYEGHYLHYNTQLSKEDRAQNFYAGDIIVPVDQPGIRYIIETLEPSAKDSFFNWNFFDTILQQKEGFSPYVFEDTAIQILKNNPDLQTAFENKRNTDPNFKENWYSQLDWLFKQSDLYEKAHMQYPIYRIARTD
ncbi:M14 family metallopeptidase [Maribacter confluentis]|uniref:M14 family metallopeptidase n=1 Tax=Maribacter confluentis TaxID=1656093 RepID=A0ABT8RM78_9FLAO|nr:M14 family metallopeptidase [Maribacter confluentis]MDO1511890.1 M14 family metallopeptidase [Maribacter confluentis]